MQAGAQNQFILRVYMPAESEQLLQHTIKKCWCSLSRSRFSQFSKFSFLVTKRNKRKFLNKWNLELGVIKAKIRKQSFRMDCGHRISILSSQYIIVLHIFLHLSQLNLPNHLISVTFCDQPHQLASSGDIVLKNCTYYT